VALISASLALSQTPVYTARPRIRPSASHGVPVYVQAFAGTHCAYPLRDGQAELTWVAGCIRRWFTRLPTVTYLVIYYILTEGYRGFFTEILELHKQWGLGDGIPPAESTGGAPVGRLRGNALSFTVTNFNGIFEQFYAY